MNQISRPDALARKMTAGSRARLAARQLLLAFGVALATFAGCSDLLVEPAVAPASIRLAITPISDEIAADGIEDAFDRADRVRIRILRETTEPVEVVQDFTPAETVTVSVTVELDEEEESATLIVELLSGSSVLFRSENPITLVSGSTPTVQVGLSAVPGRVEIAGEPRLTVTTVPETLRLRAAVLFATGDTIPGAAITWQSTDTRVASVNASGEVSVLAEGITRIRALHRNFGDEVEITVQRVVHTVVVSPAQRAIFVGDTIQLTATALDSRQNPITGRSFAWSSSDPAIEVNANGRVIALATGTATISATVDGVTGSAVISSSTRPPPTGPFHGDWYGYSTSTGGGQLIDFLHLNIAQQTGSPITGVIEGYWWGYAPPEYNDFANISASATRLQFVMAPPFGESETEGAEFDLTLNPDGTMSGQMAKCWYWGCEDYYLVYFDRDPSTMPEPYSYSREATRPPVFPEEGDDP